MDRRAQEQHDESEHGYLNQQLPAKFALQRLPADTDQKTPQQRVIVDDREVQLDQLGPALQVLQQVRYVVRARRRETLLDQRIGIVDVGAYRRSLRGHDHAVDDVLL